MASIEYGVALFTAFVTRKPIWSSSPMTSPNRLPSTLRSQTSKAASSPTIWTMRRKEITLDGVLKIADAIPTNGTQFTYATVQYILKSIDDKGTNKDYRKVSVKGIKYEQIA